MQEKYFAYGSNMFARRLCKRVPSAKVIGIYTLPAHDLRFHKRSDKDGSGKCDAYYTGDKNHAVIGRLFTIDAGEVDALDKAEGLGYGYEKKVVRVLNETGETETAFTYCAAPTAINTTIHPFTWYKQHVLTGAKEAGLPPDYIKKIEAITATPDPNRDREKIEMALHK